MALPIVTLTSASNANVNRTSPYNRSGRILRDPSFSSYLNGAEETFVLKLRSTSAREFDTIPQDRILDAEIDVFDAEKYFSESYGSEIESLPSRHMKKDDPVDMFAPPRIATASTGSESSSNGHCPLLLQPRSSRRATNNNFLASIGHKCSCRDKNSVTINSFDVQKNNNPVVKKSNPREVRVHTDVHFSFPVFQDDRKQIPLRAFNRFSDSPDDESDSDASSDLFEIGSFSMRTSDGCITPQAGYAPSEASIAWSVVTASAADFLDAEEVRSIDTTVPALSQPKNGHNQKAPKPRSSSILSGCRDYKAVDVARSHRASEEKPRYSNKNDVPGFNQRFVSKPHNGRAHHLLYT